MSPDQPRPPRRSSRRPERVPSRPTAEQRADGIAELPPRPPRVPQHAPRRPAWLRIAIAIGAAVVVLLVATLGVRATYSGKALPNTTVAGVKVGGLTEDAIRSQLVRVAGQERSLTLTGAGKRVEVKASDAGFEPNLGATVTAALDSGRGNFFAPLAALVIPRKERLIATIDSAKLDAQVDVVAKEIDRTPYAGAITIDPQTRVVSTQESRNGRAVNQRDLTEDLRDALLRSSKTQLEVPIRTTKAVSEDKVQEVARDAEEYLAKPLTLSGASKPYVVSPEQLSKLLTLEPLKNGAGARLGVNTKALTALTGRVSAARDRKARSPQFSAPSRSTKVVDGKAEVTWKPIAATVKVTQEGHGGVAVNTAELAKRIRTAVHKGEHTAQVPTKTTTAPVTQAAAQKVDRVIGTFTTPYIAGQPRVTNIQRMAKTVDGTVIAPGQQFSLNAITGERTLAKGYVEAPFIANNKIEPSVGGGVSQFSTTMYNAAYFAGLQLDAYRAHSLYIDRYPAGRESTLNFPDIDMKWTNDTKVPILIRTYADSAGVTVTLYGDNTGREVTASPGNREPNPGGNFKITITRIIKYPGGNTVRQPVTTSYANEVTEDEPQE